MDIVEWLREDSRKIKESHDGIIDCGNVMLFAAQEIEQLRKQITAFQLAAPADSENPCAEFMASNLMEKNYCVLCGRKFDN
jgi:hypothetical protein